MTKKFIYVRGNLQGGRDLEGIVRLFRARLRMAAGHGRAKPLSSERGLPAVATASSFIASRSFEVRGYALFENCFFL